MFSANDPDQSLSAGASCPFLFYVRFKPDWRRPVTVLSRVCLSCAPRPPCALARLDAIVDFCDVPREWAIAQSVTCMDRLASRICGGKADEESGEPVLARAIQAAEACPLEAL